MTSNAMTGPPVATLVVPTRNRLDDLRASLPHYVEAARSANVACELVVIDNGSTDASAAFLQDWTQAGPGRRTVMAAVPGLSRARNVACSMTCADYLIFGDDDVHVPPTWVDDMLSPLLESRAEAVAARVVLAKELNREWLTGPLRQLLAESALIERERPPLIGAGMAFDRRVLQVAMWDDDIGAGRRPWAFGEDFLFDLMLQAAGVRVVAADGPPAVHRPNPDRLERASWLKMATSHGATDAYLAHHWFGTQIGLLRLRTLRARLLVVRVRARQLGCPTVPMTWPEFEALSAVARSQTLRKERKQPRKYLPRIDVPLSALADGPPPSRGGSLQDDDR